MLDEQIDALNEEVLCLTEPNLSVVPDRILVFRIKEIAAQEHQQTRNKKMGKKICFERVF